MSVWGELGKPSRCKPESLSRSLTGRLAEDTSNTRRAREFDDYEFFSSPLSVIFRILELDMAGMIQQPRCQCCLERLHTQERLQLAPSGHFLMSSTIG
ncbi:hypothetical protein HUJ04_005641 [Dendroctonus ponderosae]|nr:hypothetical protein HUJ04_005641 [Dendroctonus ponderosae]